MSRPPVPVDTRRKPIAGFATQAEACLALTEEGLSPEAIGEKIGRDANHVRAAMRRLKAPPRARTFALPLRLASALEPAADARGVTPVELAVELIELIVRDQVVDALLGEPGDPT